MGAEEQFEGTVAILVHGTWATEAEWCKPDSDFCRTLQTAFAGPLKFVPFGWSGWNLHRARIAAGNELAAHIDRVSNEFPRAKIVVVGHSHGGNVIRYALRQETTAERVSGVVTLATPFIHVDPRPPTKWLLIVIKAFAIEALAISFLIVVGGLIYLVVELFDSRGAQQAIKSLGHLTYILIMPAILFVFGLLRQVYVNQIGWFIGTVAQTLAKRQAQILFNIDPPVIENLPVLSIEVHADEARFALVASRLLSNWMYAVPNWTLLNVLALFVGIPALLMYGFGRWLEIGWHDSMEYLIWYEISLVLTLLTAPLIVFGFMAASIGVPRATKAPVFGEETIYENWLIDSSQSTEPIGWQPGTRKTFRVPVKWYSTERALRHSLVYSTPDIVKFIGEWLRSDETNTTGPPSIHFRVHQVIVEIDYEDAIREVIPSNWRR